MNTLCGVREGFGPENIGCVEKIIRGKVFCAATTLTAATGRWRARGDRRKKKKSVSNGSSFFSLVGFDRISNGGDSYELTIQRGK